MLGLPTQRHVLRGAAERYLSLRRLLLVYGVLLVVGNLIADIALLLDPRIAQLTDKVMTDKSSMENFCSRSTVTALAKGLRQRQLSPSHG
jgi:hypothetical protein